jgi:hypothetical protein
VPQAAPDRRGAVVGALLLPGEAARLGRASRHDVGDERPDDADRVRRVPDAWTAGATLLLAWHSWASTPRKSSSNPAATLPAAQPLRADCPGEIAPRRIALPAMG